MTKRLFWMAPAAVLALTGCGTAENVNADDGQAERSTPELSEVAPAKWAQVAPGVWERPRPDGVREQLGVGVHALELELQRVKGQRALLQQVSAQGVSPRELAAQQTDIDKLIHFLESGLATARSAGAAEPPSEEPPLRVAQAGSEGTPSGSYCAGNYNFQVIISHDILGSSVTSSAQWSEFGPFAELTKNMFTFATTWRDRNPGTPVFQSDSDTTNPFTGSCCKMIQSSARVGSDYNPKLEGSAYIFGDSVCGGPHFYRAWY
ncbi:hypothetical protein ACLESO_12340 [Pyxidicoccus sp. 3LG]